MPITFVLAVAAGLSPTLPSDLPATGGPIAVQYSGAEPQVYTGAGKPRQGQVQMQKGKAPPAPTAPPPIAKVVRQQPGLVCEPMRDPRTGRMLPSNC